MPFVQFIPENVEKNIQASLTPKGTLSLNAAALKAFGLEKATHVFLFFDPERRVLGLRAASPELPGAVRLMRRKRVAAVQVAPLLHFYRLVVTGKLLLEPKQDEKENLIILPLLGARKRPGRKPQRPSLGKPRPKGRKTALEATAEGTPRRRGRPRKTLQPPPEPAPAPRKRGRPPKSSE
ncbi:MAG: hypothetical protein ACUVRY_02705 [Thermoanaerobaculaceae bacterium]